MRRPVLEDLHGLGTAAHVGVRVRRNLQFHALHPQGLCRVDSHYWMTSVDKDSHRAWLFRFTPLGELIDRIELTDGERYHPSGFDQLGGAFTIALAEYHANGSTRVVRMSCEDLAVVELFVHPGHLGAVAALPDGSIVGATWGGRQLLRLSVDGEVLGKVEHTARPFDTQDMQRLDDRHILCSGIREAPTPGGRRGAVGGLAIADADTLGFGWSMPVYLRSDEGNVLTRNPLCVELRDEQLVLVAVPDDGDGALYECTVTPA